MLVNIYINEQMDYTVNPSNPYRIRALCILKTGLFLSLSFTRTLLALERTPALGRKKTIILAVVIAGW